jgi:hypothetical protein
VDEEHIIHTKQRETGFKLPHLLPYYIKLVKAKHL